MHEKELIRCDVCGVMFVPRHGNQKLCGTICRDERQRQQAQNWKKAHSMAERRKAEKQTVADVLRYAERHRKRTGTYLSYGQAVARMEREGYRV